MHDRNVKVLNEKNCITLANVTVQKKNLSVLDIIKVDDTNFDIFINL